MRCNQVQMAPRGPLWCALYLCSLLVAAEGQRDALVVPLRRKDGGLIARGLLRNATLPLHGAVKDYGCALFLFSDLQTRSKRGPESTSPARPAPHFCTPPAVLSPAKPGAETSEQVDKVTVSKILNCLGSIADIRRPRCSKISPATSYQVNTLLCCRYFYATLLLGSPPRSFAVIVDTGSTITYVPCTSCGHNCGPHHKVLLPGLHALEVAELPQKSALETDFLCTSVVRPLTLNHCTGRGL